MQDSANWARVCAAACPWNGLGREGRPSRLLERVLGGEPFRGASRYVGFRAQNRSVAPQGRTLQSARAGTQVMRAARRILDGRDIRMKNGTANIVTLVVVAIYLLAPIDVVSDAIPVIGQLDDTLVAVAALMTTMARLKSQ